MAIIVCEECGHKVSDRAAGCPSCGAPIAVTTAVLRRGQRAIIGAVIALGALALLGTQIWFNTSRSPGRSSVIGKTSSASLEPPGPAEQFSRAQHSGELNESTRTVYQTTAERLYQDYQANGVATQSKIANSRVRITGKISAIDEDAAGKPVVKLAASTENSVNMTLGEDAIAAAAQLSRGQTVDIECDVMRRVMGSPEGSHCNLVLVQGVSPASAVASRGAVPAAQTSELHSVTAGGAAAASRKSRKSLPATPIAMVATAPAAPSLSTDGTSASVPVVAVAAEETAAVSSIPAGPIPAAPIGPAASTAPVPSAPPAANASEQQRVAEAPAQAPVPVPVPVPVPAPVPAQAQTERSTPASDAGASAQNASPPPATSSPAVFGSDDLAAVRAADPQAAEHIASYCANSTAASASGAATCRNDEKEAWTRLVQNNEFPALDAATRLKCSQPPFPDSYRAKEICAKYELRIY